MNTNEWLLRRLRGRFAAQSIALGIAALLSACAGTPRLPQCHGPLVPINAPVAAKDAHGTRR